MAYHAFVDHSLVDNQQYVQDAIFHEALNQDYHDNNHDTDITELTYEQKIERDHPLNDKQFDANNPHTIESCCHHFVLRHTCVPCTKLYPGLLEGPEFADLQNSLLNYMMYKSIELLWILVLQARTILESQQ